MTIVMTLLVILLVLYAGRKIGWTISKFLLYTSPMFVVVILCIAWGIFCAIILKFFIQWLHPGLVLKILGFGTVSYISIPNYGLVAENTIPKDKEIRHSIIYVLPLAIFLIASIIIFFVLK